MLSALADVHVKSEIVAGLRLRGMDVSTAQELNLDEVPDDVLLTESSRLGRVLLTSDKGFLRLDAEWTHFGRHHAGIIFWPQRNRSIGEIVRGVLSYSHTVP